MTLTMRPLATLLALALALPLALTMANPDAAAPYCADLVNKDALDKKFKRLAPIHTDDQTGWIFTRDQLPDSFAMKAEAAMLMGQIATEFANRGMPLAIMIAPPRSIVAGQDIVDQTIGQRGAYDVAAATASFNSLITDLQAAGAMVPNLADVAIGDPDTRAGFYFQRDTHWTPLGADRSARGLAATVAAARPALFPDALKTPVASPSSEMLGERGSLAKIVKSVCDTPLDEEIVPLMAHQPVGGDLFGDLATGAPRIALIGTSFSNRYKTDAYRVGDALAEAFGAQIDNFSISGGGMIGPIEAFILSGGLKQKDHDLVVWEVPYTESFNTISALRQMLGALKVRAGQVTTLGAITSTTVDLNVQSPAGVTVRPANGDVRKITLELEFNKGGRKTIKLVRKSQIPADQRADLWAASLSGYEGRVLKSVKVSFSPNAAGDTASLEFWTN
jgi:alginate biosynthesis protein AlgX